MMISDPMLMQCAPERLLTLIEAQDANPAAEAGITDVSRYVPPGFYPRKVPVFLDLEEAEPETRDRIIETTQITEQHYTSMYTAKIEGALLTGQGTVITRNGVIIYESAAEFLGLGNTPDGLLCSDNRCFRLAHSITMDIAEPCLLVKRPWYRNFGHWLVDCATMLCTLAQAPAAASWPIVIGSGFDPAMRRIVFETIVATRPDATLLEHRDQSTWRFGDLRYVMPLHTPPQFKLPAALNGLRNFFIDGRPPIAGRRIFVSRRDAQSRKLTNHDEVEQWLLTQGFETVMLHGSTLLEQASIFAEAEVIVGVKGAALTNMVFCSAAAKVLILTPGDFSDPFFWDIAAQRGMHYAELAGAITTSHTKGFNDFAIETTRLSHSLKALLTGSSSSQIDVVGAPPPRPGQPA